MDSPRNRPHRDRIDQALQLWFFVLAIGSIVAFFFFRQDSPWLFQSLGVAALVIRVLYYLKQLFFTKKG